MKITSIEVMTDLGRRVVQLSAPLDVDPRGDMPPHFRSLTEVLWGVVQQSVVQEQEFSALSPRAEA